MFILWDFFNRLTHISPAVFSYISTRKHVFWLWCCKLFKRIYERCHPVYCSGCMSSFVAICLALPNSISFSWKWILFHLQKVKFILWVWDTDATVHSSFPYLSHLSSFQSFKNLKRIQWMSNVWRVLSQ